MKSKARVLHHKENSIIFNFIKCLLKFQVEDNNNNNNNNILLRLVAKVEIFKRSCQVVIDGFCFYKTILIFLIYADDNILKHISQKFAKKIESQTHQRDGYETMKAVTSSGLLILVINKTKAVLLLPLLSSEGCVIITNVKYQFPPSS